MQQIFYSFTSILGQVVLGFIAGILVATILKKFSVWLAIALAIGFVVFHVYGAKHIPFFDIRKLMESAEQYVNINFASRATFAWEFLTSHLPFALAGGIAFLYKMSKG
jgi:uncharacterized membrane protein (Fun14 family)